MSSTPNSSTTATSGSGNASASATSPSLSNPNNPSNTPLHRRPSWAGNPDSYQHYMRNTWKTQRQASKSTSDNFGSEPFSYDDKHLAPFRLPKDLNDPKVLPSEILLTANDWAQAGAALETALERCTKLRAEAVTRGWPGQSALAHLSREPQTASPGTKEATRVPDKPFKLETPLTNSGAEQSHLSPIQLTASAITSAGIPQPATTALPTMPNMGIGMESPPFTPRDGMAPGTPMNPLEAAKATPPDLRQVDNQLSPAANPGLALPTPSVALTVPFNSPASTNGASTPAGQPGTGFDERAWETYLRAFHAEVEDLNHSALKRFRGFGMDQDKLVVEFGRGAGHPDHGRLEEEFKARGSEWEPGLGKFLAWREGQKGKLPEFVERVKAVKEPSLEEVKMEREAKGLPV